MRYPPLYRVVAGAIVWVLLAAGLVGGVRHFGPRDGFPTTSARRVAAYLTSEPARCVVVFPPGTASRAGDRVFARSRESVVTVGQIRRVRRETAGTVVELEFFGDPPFPLTLSTRFIAVPNPRTPAWVFKVLLPPEKRENILASLRGFAEDHREEIIETFWPPFELFLRDAFRILYEDLPGVLRDRKEEMRALLDRHEETTFRDQLLPVLEEEVWPCVQERSAPVVEEVGKEIWERLPLWGLGWRYVYQKVPFTDKEILSRRWKAFVKKEAMPVLEAHMEDFLEVVGEVLSETAGNPRVSAAVRESLVTLMDDPAFTALMRDVFLDLIAPEGRVFRALRSRFSSPDFVDRLNRLLEALGPLLNRTANRLMLDATGEAINPDLARVLRTQILWKDACWILVEPGNGDATQAPLAFPGETYDWKAVDQR